MKFRLTSWVPANAPEQSTFDDRLSDMLTGMHEAADQLAAGARSSDS